jgi:NAD(P)-dependent dehydrogenase (short-subunit alcohol dehydrogenase family)
VFTGADGSSRTTRTQNRDDVFTDLKDPSRGLDRAQLWQRCRPRQKEWTVAASITGAIEAFTHAIAVELAPLCVNAVAPGVVRTELWDSIPQAEREAFYNGVGQAMRAGRIGEPMRSPRHTCARSETASSPAWSSRSTAARGLV